MGQHVVLSFRTDCSVIGQCSTWAPSRRVSSVARRYRIARVSVITKFEGRPFKKNEGRAKSEGVVFDLGLAEDVSNDASVASRGATKSCGVT